MLVDSSQDFTLLVQFTDPTTGAAAIPNANPTFRIFGANGATQDGNGTAELLSTGDITAITTGAQTVITSAGHNLVVGQVVTIEGSDGMTGVNGTHTITAVTADTFTYATASTGTYGGSGASWSIPGLYAMLMDAPIRSGLEVGKNYVCIAYGVFDEETRPIPIYFTVVA